MLTHENKYLLQISATTNVLKHKHKSRDICVSCEYFLIVLMKLKKRVLNIRAFDMSSSFLNTVPVALLQFEDLIALNLENNELASIPNLDSLVNLVRFKTKRSICQVNLLICCIFPYRNGLMSLTISFKVYR